MEKTGELKNVIVKGAFILTGNPFLLAVLGLPCLYQLPLLLRSYFHLRIFAALLACRTSIFLTYVLNALEATRNVLDLPALIGPYLFALHPAAGTDSSL